MHALEEASNFNESMYFNVYDPAERIGGFLRLGNRANEGYAELTTCLYLPDGRVAFTYNRPKIADNDAFDAGGTRFEVVTPFEELRTTYDGKLALLTEPLQMANPRQAFTENPWVEAHVDLTHRGVSPMYGGEPVNDDGITALGRPLRRLRPRPLRTAHGGRPASIRVGDDEWPVHGFGLRDHSWGPRYWQAPWWYRWLTANFGAEFGFVVSIIASRDGGRRYGGMVLRNGVYEHIQHATIETVWSGDDQYHAEVRATATTEVGHLRDHRPRPQPDPVAQPPRDARGRATRDAHLRRHDRMVVQRDDRLRPLRIPRPDHRRPPGRRRRGAAATGALEQQRAPGAGRRAGLLPVLDQLRDRHQRDAVLLARTARGTGSARANRRRAAPRRSRRPARSRRAGRGRPPLRCDRGARARRPRGRATGTRGRAGRSARAATRGRGSCGRSARGRARRCRCPRRGGRSSR